MLTKKPYPIKEGEHKRQALLLMWQALSADGKEEVEQITNRKAGYISQVATGFAKPVDSKIDTIFVPILERWTKDCQQIKQHLILSENE
jgi:hypothetical protein